MFTTRLPERKPSKHLTLKSDSHDPYKIAFDSDSFEVFLDSCVTQALTGFKLDFIENTFQESKHVAIDTALGSMAITGKDVARFCIQDDDGDFVQLQVPIHYSSKCKYRLITPQWLAKIYRMQGIDRNERTKMEIEDEYSILHLDRRKRKKTIQYHPVWEIPVVCMNIGHQKVRYIPQRLPFRDTIKFKM